MPNVDSTGQAQIATGSFAPAFFIWVDVLGDPIRVTTFGQNVTFSGTGDSDLDGNTFISFNPHVVSVGDVSNSDNGSDTLSVTLSDIVSIDPLQPEIATITNWRGRTVRLWMQVYDPTGQTKQGAIVPYYTGYASSVKIMPAPDSNTAQLDVENYLSLFSAASNRSYLDQSYYDAADVSAAATIAASNIGPGGSPATAAASSTGVIVGATNGGQGYRAYRGQQF